MNDKLMNGEYYVAVSVFARDDRVHDDGHAHGDDRGRGDDHGHGGGHVRGDDVPVRWLVCSI